MKLAVFRRLCLVATLLALVVIVMGAWVRLSHAGLGCPDWPGCYGHLTVGQAVENAERANAAFPERPLEPDKALKEMIHRYAASGLGLLILAIAIVAWLNRRDPAQPMRLPGFLVALVVFQGLLGMWTVTLLVKPAVVTAHLLGGLATMALCWWLALRVDRTTRPPGERGLRRLAIAGLVVLVLQIMLGGWVSTNYAALACPDFPTCQIHFVHRIGAVVTALVLGLLAWRAIRTGQSRAVRAAGATLAALVVVQWTVGPLMVLKALPLELATAHNGVAALLVLAVVALLRFLWTPRTLR